jgi:hypothetical protein
MRRFRRLWILIATATAAPGALIVACPEPAGAAVDPLIAAARLSGTWGMLGSVTKAVGVPDENRGEIVERAWTFVPLCPIGQCTEVQLQRSRAGGTDTLVLTRRRPGYYTGTGSFYAPARCRGRSFRKGELVPFTITLRITAALSTSGGAAATQATATYRNPRRIGLTRCVTPPSYDAATYAGGPLVAPAIRREARTRSSTARRRRRSGPEAATTT